MPAPKNSFKEALLNGHPQIGCWIGMADAYAAEISATAGFDWLLVDGEHAPNDLRSILAQIRVIEASEQRPSGAIADRRNLDDQAVFGCRRTELAGADGRKR